MIMEHLAVDWAEVQVPERNVDQKEEWLDNKTNKKLETILLRRLTVC